MQTRSYTLLIPARITLLGRAAALALAAAACGSAGEPPSALPSAGASAGGTSGGAAANGGSSNGGSSGAAAGGTPSAGAAGEEGEPDAGGAGTGGCNPQLFETPPPSADHQPECSEIVYSTTPPSGGDHYDIWAAYQTYDYPLPAGYVVHNLEHGAIVFWYDCPEGCADEVAEVQTFIDSQPEDPLCEGFSAVRRVLLVPSPGLGVRWAASAWGYVLVAECFDSAEFGAFYTTHYGQGRESLCNDGQVIAPGACP
jgi:Protein of unknown function (DUF3105)